jgi:hydroxyacyl-ACP dehydratase HTD2-like protein with hotdog domain
VLKMTDPDLASHLVGWSPQPVDRPWVPTAEAIGVLAGVLGVPDEGLPREGSPVPALWHWASPPALASAADLGDDGHPAEGAFYPPIPARRRMFVGGRLEVRHPLLVGILTEERTELVGADVKSGRTGEMLFVTLRRTFCQGGEVCLVEEQDLMYRSGAPSSGPSSSTAVGGLEAVAPWRMQLVVDPVRLFLFSALTANAHRIHYDLPYARDVERYDGLVVHGPLLVLGMLELARQHAGHRAVRTVSYRLRSPVFAHELVQVTGGPSDEGRVELRIGSERTPGAAVATIDYY